MDPLFSVILPTYNRAYVLWRAIQSVIAQTEPRWELMVVDDGSTDDTLRLLEEFRDPRIRTFSITNGGASAARNYGARQTQAPYLAYIDSDNTWHAEYLATMLRAIERHPDGVLWYCGQNTSLWQRNAARTWMLEHVLVEPRAQYSPEDVLQLCGADTNCIVHTRPLLKELGGWDEACSFLEDWDLFARCVQRYPSRIYWVPKILVEYRQVYGAAADGLCASAVQDPARKRAQWRYLVEKWRSQPGFEATAQLLTEKHLS